MICRKEGEALIHQFKTKYFNLTGNKVSVTVISAEETRTQLEQIDEVVSIFIPEKLRKKYPSIKASVKTRKRELSDLRKIFSKIAYDEGYNYVEIGQYFDNQDHTTIMNNVKKANIFIENIKSFRSLYNNTIKILFYDIRNVLTDTDTSLDSEPVLQPTLD